METLSSSVSPLNVPSLTSIPSSGKPNQFKAPVSGTIKSHYLYATKPGSISSRPSSPSPHGHPDLLLLSSLSRPAHIKLRPSSRTHKNPATGYAAALINVAQSNRSLEKTLRRVQRLSKFLETTQARSLFDDPSVGKAEKGRIVKEAAEKGNFGKHLMSLLKMLIERSKIGILNEVLIEFERIYDEMVGNPVIWVSPRENLGEDLYGITKAAARRRVDMKGKVKQAGENLSYKFVA